ncbi:hypothetical protein INT45_004570 [Circinella minor]|uniref:Zn(2)-C6 fungal-type domain-containing protein n=1 Tax=Circinella minor TaxID=1195481 RepID=A0A8H7RW12_9FUNG|nr:hypothetical protein INT45_004570 [Circinella minor]
MTIRKPCKRCQATRKKCTWPQQQQHNTTRTNNSNSNVSCIRCAKSRFQCIPSDTTNKLHFNFEPEGTIDGQPELHQWQRQLDDIEINFKKMKDTVQDLLLPPTPNKNTMSHHSNKLEWNLIISPNGYVRLGTIIKSLDELLLYSQASMRYLSPFSGIFETEHIRLENSTASIAITSMSYLFRVVNNKLVAQNYQHCIASNKSTWKAIETTTAMGSNNYYDMTTINNSHHHDDNFYKTQMEKLIHLYLEHINPLFGLLHEPTFRTYYKSFGNPLDCPIALSLCVETAIMLRSCANLSSIESRHLADYFYYKSKDILTDIFDDPKRPLETVMTITFLLSYLFNVRMNCIEARLYVTISLLLCNELEKQFNQYNNDDDNDCQCKNCQQEQQQQQQHPYHNHHDNNKNKNEMMMDPMVGKVMFQRHRLETMISQRLIELYLYGQVDFFNTVIATNIQILEDEPQSVNEHYTVHNAILELFKTRYMSTLLKQVNQVMHGESSDLRLDFILLFETVVREWWTQLSPELRFCDDPYKVDKTYMLTIQPQNSMQIASFATLHLWTAVIHSSILKARISSSSHDLIHLLQEKAALTAWKSCQMTVYALDKSCQIYGNNIMSTSLIHFDYLRLMYALSSVITYGNLQIDPEDMQDILGKCDTIQQNYIPNDHRVPLGHSKLEEFMTSISNTSTRSNHTYEQQEGSHPEKPLNVYYEYPLPGLALLSDLCSTAFHQLEKLYYNSNNSNI